MRFGDPSNYFLEEYYQNNQGKSRYDIDLQLLQQGYSPETIEDFWKSLAAKETSFYLFNPQTWKYLKTTQRILLIGAITVFLVAVLSLEFGSKIRALFHAPATHLSYEINVNGGISTIAFSPDGRFLATANTNGMQLWYMPERKLYFGSKDYSSAPPQNLVWSPNSSKLAYSIQYGVVTVSQMDSSDSITINSHNSEVKSLSFSPDGLLLAIAGDTQPIQIWSFDKNIHLESQLDCVANKVKFLSYDHVVGLSNDGILCDFAFSASRAVVKKIGSMDSLSREDKIFFSADNKRETFSPNYQILAESTVLVSDPAECRNQIGPVIKLSQVKDGSKIESLNAPMCGTSEVAFSPDEKILAAAGNDGIVRIWYLNREFPLLR